MDDRKKILLLFIIGDVLFFGLLLGLWLSGAFASFGFPGPFH